MAAYPHATSRLWTSTFLSLRHSPRPALGSITSLFLGTQCGMLSHEGPTADGAFIQALKPCQACTVVLLARPVPRLRRSKTKTQGF